MMRQRPRSGNQGFAMFLVMVYIFMAVAVVAGVSTAVLSAHRTTDNLDASRKALEAAEYGEVQVVSGLNGGSGADLGLAAWRKLQEQTPAPAPLRQLPAFSAPGVAPLRVAALPGAEYVATAEPFRQNAQGDDAGAGAASPEQAELVVVYAAGRCGNAEHRLEAVYRAVPARQDGMSKTFTRIAWREISLPR